MEWYFVCDSDVQYKIHNNGKISPISDNKINKINTIIDLQKQFGSKLDLVLHTGDLINLGDDMKSFDVFKKEYVKVIETNNLKLLMCPGNHDSYIKYFPYCKPVFKYLKNKYNCKYNLIMDWNKACCYKVKHNGIYFISMGIYPKNLVWLTNNLPNKDEPIIIFYHYNTADNPFSDWWTNTEKENFYNTIKNHNILLIVDGHWHQSGKNEWKGIPEVRGAGSKVALVKVINNTINNITFH